MRILIIEDDPDLRELLESILTVNYSVDAVGDLESARDYLRSYHYTILLLDRNLLGSDIGLTLIQPAKAKNPQCGILVMSAYGNVIDKIEGLNQGADDYIEKPFDIDELLARINALARRFTPSTLSFGTISVDTLSQSIMAEGKTLTLSKKEHAIFFTLIGRLGNVVSRDEILSSIYENPENVSSNTIDVMINTLRKKLNPGIITTIKTRGYMIEYP
ncbi:MAG: response regulator transcription factor [Sulfuricurvum sp.]|jgi:two-component system OmpR family response regulator|uniref:response regulator transcription factor n=1 Tax=Sulfuricurvum sp. TaxID=2025608 RepID=UPI0025CBFEDA|nr:response regulator transcription factor [Sulfuricurvum sp.]MCK9372381.1 response regulator transcription factor [Sulfuricurvum sp.]